MPDIVTVQTHVAACPHLPGATHASGVVVCFQCYRLRPGKAAAAADAAPPEGDLAQASAALAPCREPLSRAQVEHRGRMLRYLESLSAGRIQRST